jgi:8-oxo-dGTP diphosphatase
LRHLVVGVIIAKGDQILLLKRGTYNGKPMVEFGKWGFPGGYVDRNELIVDAVKRETIEETGWKIKNVKLLRIVDNPDRPNDLDRQNISMIFTADAVSQIPVVTEETQELKWFSLDSLPDNSQIAFDFDEDLSFYRNYLKDNLKAPILA